MVRTAQEALKIFLAAQRDMGKTNASWRNFAIARNTLHEEPGYYDERSREYGLSEDVRDTLIAHGRQDASHACDNTISLLDDVAALENKLRFTSFVLLANFVGLLFLLISPR
jgi:hypothetical protein